MRRFCHAQNKRQNHPHLDHTVGNLPELTSCKAQLKQQEASRLRCEALVASFGNMFGRLFHHDTEKQQQAEHVLATFYRHWPG